MAGVHASSGGGNATRDRGINGENGQAAARQDQGLQRPGLEGMDMEMSQVHHSSGDGNAALDRGMNGENGLSRAREDQGLKRPTLGKTKRCEDDDVEVEMLDSTGDSGLDLERFEARGAHFDRPDDREFTEIDLESDGENGDWEERQLLDRSSGNFRRRPERTATPGIELVPMNPNDFRVTSSGNLSDHLGHSGAVVLRTGTEDELGEDLELYAEQFGLWRFTKNQARSKKRLAQFRRDLLCAAKQVRENKPDIWTYEIQALLNKVLMVADAKLSGKTIFDQSMFSLALEELEEPSIQFEAIQNNFYQHEVNLQECRTICFGWVFVWLLCYLPWYMVLWFFYRDHQNDEDCLDGENTFIYGMIYLLPLNGLINCLVSCFHTIDKGNTGFSRVSNRLVQLTTCAFLAFVIYGLTLIWNPRTVSGIDYCAYKNLIVAMVVAFLALPFLCFALQCWMDRRN